MTFRRLDLRSFILILETEFKNLTPQEQEQIISSVNSPSRKEALRSVAESFFDREVRRNTHEIYHFWQHIWLPFLYVMASKNWQNAIQARREIQQRETSFSWPDKQLPRTNAWDLLYQSAKVSVRKPKDIFIEPIKDKHNVGVLSPWFLMENATSLFEYRTSQGGEGEADGYRRWSNRYGAYRSAYNLLAELTDSDTAFLALEPLINAALHTTVPLVAFCYLAREIDWSQLVDLDSERLFNGLVNFLAQELPSVDIGKDGMVLTDTPCFIPHDIIDNMPRPHPLLGVYRKRRQMRGKDWSPFINPFAPAHQNVLIDNFMPPVRVFLISDAEKIGVQVGCVTIGDDLGDVQGQSILALNSVLGAVDAIRGEERTPGRHPCQWVQCRFHCTDLCRSHFSTPSDGRSPESQCSFPVLLHKVCNIKLQPDGLIAPSTANPAANVPILKGENRMKLLIMSASGDECESLAQAVLVEPEDTLRIEMSGERQHRQVHGAAAEPITVGVILVAIAVGAAAGFGEKLGEKAAEALWEAICEWIKREHREVLVEEIPETPADHPVKITITIEQAERAVPPSEFSSLVEALIIGNQQKNGD